MNSTALDIFSVDTGVAGICEIDSNEADNIVIYDLARMRRGTKEINFKKNTETMPEWAERRRVLPIGTPFPGKWKNSRTPYTVAIGEALSPQSSTEIVTFVAPSQVGKTAATAENMIGFTIDVDPGPMLYVTATRDLAIQWSETRVGPMLELCGLDKKLRSPTSAKGARSTGNKVLSKMFTGGNLLFASYGQAAMMRSSSFQKIVFDEIDKAVDTVEGEARKFGEMRTTAYEGRRKICLVSTPLEEFTSKIWKAFKEGTMCFYWVPCPHCYNPDTGEGMTRLDLLDENLKCRLEYDFVDEAKTIVDEDSVGIPCFECGALIRNEDKELIYRTDKCEYKPTNPNPLPRNESFAIDAAYAKPGMVSFKTLAQEWVNALGDPEAMKIFINHRGARPYKEDTERPTDEQVKSKIGAYKRRTVPDGPILFTVGADLHKDRLDVEIVGFNGRESWSIDWMHYHGKATFDEGGSLRNFANDFIANKLPGNPVLAFVDYRYEPDEVVRLAASVPDIFAIKGEDWIGSGVPFAESILTKYDGMEYVRVNTGLMKDRMKNALRMEPYDGEGHFPDGFPHFPIDYEPLYFDQLNSEARIAVKDPRNPKKIIKWKWEEIHSKGNHALDCRVYAIAACEYQIYRLAQKMELESDYLQIVWECLRDPENVDLILQMS